MSELYEILLGREDRLEPVYERLREIGVADPNERERAMERIAGAPAPSRGS